MDISPLINYLVTLKYLPSDVYLGQVHFGTETIYSPKPVKFEVNTFYGVMDVVNTTSEVIKNPTVTRIAEREAKSLATAIDSLVVAGAPGKSTLSLSAVALLFGLAVGIQLY